MAMKGAAIKCIRVIGEGKGELLLCKEEQNTNEITKILFEKEQNTNEIAKKYYLRNSAIHRSKAELLCRYLVVLMDIG